MAPVHLGGSDRTARKTDRTYQSLPLCSKLGHTSPCWRLRSFYSSAPEARRRTGKGPLNLRRSETALLKSAVVPFRFRCFLSSPAVPICRQTAPNSPPSDTSISFTASTGFAGGIAPRRQARPSVWPPVHRSGLCFLRTVFPGDAELIQIQRRPEKSALPTNIKHRDILLRAPYPAANRCCRRKSFAASVSPTPGRDQGQTAMQIAQP